MKPRKQNKRPNKRNRFQKWLLPALAALLLAAVLVTVAYVRQENQIRLDHPVFQYFLNQRMDYAAGTRLILGKYNVIFQQSDGRSDGDDSPIYERDHPVVLLPRPMSWIDPVSGQEWCVPALSRLQMEENGQIRCSTGKTEHLLSGGFLSDAAGTVLLLDTATVQWDGNTEQLTPFSFFSTANGQTRAYCYDSETLVWEPAEQTAVLLESSLGYRVDLTTGIYTDAAGERRLLAANPKALTQIGTR